MRLALTFILLTNLCYGQTSPQIPRPLFAKIKHPITNLTQEQLFELGQQKLVGKAPCKYDELRDKLFTSNPEAKKAYDLQNEQIAKQVKKIEAEKATGNYKAGIHTIPVVFHILHLGEPIGSGANITEEQIFSAVAALNRDYRKTAADGGIAQGAGQDTEIEFCLASIDPNGNPTTGINRINANAITNYSTRGIEEDVNGTSLKNLSKWPTANYVNIWVVREIDNEGEFEAWNGGTLGYAYPVSGLATTNPNINPANNELDGIVALYFATGNLPTGTDPNYRLLFKLNRTLTHEMGHHLNLQHPFQGGSCTETNCVNQGDFVCDTPPTILNENCSNPACSGTQQVTNYMDYTGETCVNQFTAGQKTRMQAVLTGTSRSSLPASAKCDAATQNDVSLVVVLVPGTNQCGNTFNPQLIIQNRGGANLTSFTATYNFDGGTSIIYNYTGNLSYLQKDTIDLNLYTATAGSHTFSVALTSPNGQSDENTADNTGNRTFTATSGNPVVFHLLPDCFGSEISWTIKTGSTTVMSGGPYANSQAPTEISVSGCLTNACYVFRINDLGQDGLNGEVVPTCGLNGDFELVDGTGNIIIEMGQANYGASATFNFCLPFIKPSFSATPTITGTTTNIQFTDLTSSNPVPTSWRWDFGDGTFSTQQNPQHSYSSSGFKNVELMVGNGMKTDSLTKKNFIRILNPTTACDTLRNILNTDQLTYYSLGTGLGYFPGSSGYSISKFADAHTTLNSVSIKRFRVPVALAKAASPANTVKFTIYGDNNGKPGTELGSKLVQINTLKAGLYNDVLFDSPVTFDGRFYVGFEIDQTKADSIVINTAANRGTNNFKSAYTYTNSWIDVDDLFGGMTTSLGIEVLFSNAVKANATLSDSSVCEGTTVQFTSTSTNANSLSWSFPGGSPTSSSSTSGIVTFNTFGNYVARLVATGNCNYTDTSYIPVSVRGIPDLTFSSTPEACGGANGTATVTVSNSPSHTISWSNLQTTATISGLTAGTYSATVTDSQCGAANGSILVESANTLDVGISPQTPEFCEGDSISLTATGAATYTWRENGVVMSTSNKYNTVATVAIYIEVVGKSGTCIDSADFQPLVYPRPTMTASANPLITDIAFGGNVDFSSAGSAGANQFSWTFGDGGTAVVPNPSHVYSSTGTFNAIVTGTSAFNCSNKDTVVIQVINTTGVAEYDAENISLFPNPANNQLTIKLSAGIELSNLEIINAIGQKTDVDFAPQTEFIISLTDYPAGVYLLRLQTNKGEIIRPLQIIK